MALVVSGIWLHIFTPIQTATLMVGYGLVTQSYGIWKLRHALSWRNVAPFIIGGALGVPIGAMLLLTYIDPAHLRTGVGLLLVLTASMAWRGRSSGRSSSEPGPMSASDSLTGCLAD